MRTKHWAAFAAVAVGGCSQGVSRYELSGRVTYNGKPVSRGVLIFEPDDSKGNVGPAAQVQFRDGEYRTERGRGVVGGPHVIRVQGFDGVRDPNGELPGGRPLFPETVISADLPPNGGQLDIVVPAKAKE